MLLYVSSLIRNVVYKNLTTYKMKYANEQSSEKFHYFIVNQCKKISQTLYPPCPEQ